MCNVNNGVGRYLRGISTFDADDSISVLTIIHCKYENQENYESFTEFFNSHFSELTSSDVLMVYEDSAKGLNMQLKQVF